MKGEGRESQFLSFIFFLVEKPDVPPVQPATQSRRERHHQQNTNDQNGDTEFGARTKNQEPESRIRLLKSPRSPLFLSASLRPVPFSRPPASSTSRQPNATHTKRARFVLHRCVFFFIIQNFTPKRTAKSAMNLICMSITTAVFDICMKHSNNAHVNYDGHFRHMCAKLKILHSLEPLHTCHRRI